jgi:hypothetical protein
MLSKKHKIFTVSSAFFLEFTFFMLFICARGQFFLSTEHLVKVQYQKASSTWTLRFPINFGIGNADV